MGFIFMNIYIYARMCEMHGKCVICFRSYTEINVQLQFCFAIWIKHSKSYQFIVIWAYCIVFCLAFPANEH